MDLPSTSDQGLTIKYEYIDAPKGAENDSKHILSWLAYEIYEAENRLESYSSILKEKKKKMFPNFNVIYFVLKVLIKRTKKAIKENDSTRAAEFKNKTLRILNNFVYAKIVEVQSSSYHPCKREIFTHPRKKVLVKVGEAQQVINFVKRLVNDSPLEYSIETMSLINKNTVLLTFVMASDYEKLKAKLTEHFLKVKFIEERAQPKVEIIIEDILDVDAIDHSLEQIIQKRPLIIKVKKTSNEYWKAHILLSSSDYFRIQSKNQKYIYIGEKKCKYELPKGWMSFL